MPLQPRLLYLHHPLFFPYAIIALLGVVRFSQAHLPSQLEVFICKVLDELQNRLPEYLLGYRLKTIARRLIGFLFFISTVFGAKGTFRLREGTIEVCK